MGFLTYVAVASVAAVQCTVFAVQGNSNVQTAFEESNYVPSVLPKAPQNVVNVYYTTVAVCLGNVISQTRLSEEPRIEYDFKPGVNYTLVMVDPDMPSAQAPSLGSFLVWFVVNIDGSVGCQSGEVMAKYMNPSPYPGSGKHRYTILVYEQRKPIDSNDLMSRRYGVKRYKFSVVALAKEYGLKLAAGNFFYTSLPAIKDEYYCNSPYCTDLASKFSSFASLYE